MGKVANFFFGAGKVAVGIVMVMVPVGVIGTLFVKKATKKMKESMFGGMMGGFEDQPNNE